MADSEISMSFCVSKRTDRVKGIEAYQMKSKDIRVRRDKCDSKVKMLVGI